MVRCGSWFSKHQTFGFIAKQEEEQVVAAVNTFLEISDKTRAARTD